MESSIPPAAKEVGRHIQRYVRAILTAGWLPVPGSAHWDAMKLRWNSPAPVRLLTDPAFADVARRSLNTWGAFRSRPSPSTETLLAAFGSLRPEIRRLLDVTLLNYRAVEHLDDIAALFGKLRGIKDVERNWVATSKALYLLLPDLVPPMDNLFTKPYLGQWPLGPNGSGRRRRGDEATTAFLEHAFTHFSGIARSANPTTLERLASLRWHPDSPAGVPRFGLARVVDVAIAGYVFEGRQEPVRVR
jgi:hypothetical protein